MRFRISILLVLFLLSCKSEQANNEQSIEINRSKILAIPEISAINAKFPLVLDAINFSDKENLIQLNNQIKSKLEKTINNFYYEECHGDSAETYFSIGNTYINTIRLHDSCQTIFMVLFRHTPGGKINSKVLFYNNDTEQFNNKVLDFNIHALYHLENGRLQPTNLKNQFEIKMPEIALVDNHENGINDYKFTRLFHIGTANAIETTIIRVKENVIDTLLFEREWIQ